MDTDDIVFVEVDFAGEGFVEPLITKIGEGGNASVFRSVEVLDTKRTVAVKLVDCSPEDLHKGTPSLLERFKDEIKTWNEFATSRHVVRLFYPFRHKTRPPNERCFLGIVMEHADLGDLSKNLNNRDLFARRRRDLYSFLRRIALAIKEGHDKDITHGDIKPHNVLLFKSDGSISPKVMDFGMGLSASLDITKYGGTPEYLAPERFGSGWEYVRPQTIQEGKQPDVYSLGVLFFEIITGARPYQADRGLSDQERWRKYRNLHEAGTADFAQIEKAAGIDLESLVRRMMSIKPTDVDARPLRPILNEIVFRLERMVQDSRTIEAREQECPIAIRKYRWNPEVHRQLGSRLHYYLIKGRSPDGDPKWFRNHLEEKGLRAFSFYRILGGFDYILRIWVKANDAEQVDGIIEMFKTQHGTDYLQFSVEHAEPCYGVRDLTYVDEAAILGAIEESANEKDRKAELKSFVDRGLVGGLLDDCLPESILFFLTIHVSGSPNEALLEMYAFHIKRRLATETAAKDISIYRGGGSFHLLAKFRLKKFQEFRALYEAFPNACNYVRQGDSSITSQTYVELDERGVIESDDGSIVGDLVHRLDGDGGNV